MFSKDPDARLDYGVDWSRWLSAGDEIVSSEWQLTTSGITLSEDSLNGAATKVWVAGGEVGKTYVLVNAVTTADGRRDERTIRITIKEK